MTAPAKLLIVSNPFVDEFFADHLFRFIVAQILRLS
jgi:hypothetical protein